MGMGVWAWGSGKWRMEETAGARHSVPKAPARGRSHLEGWDGVRAVKGNLINYEKLFHRCSELDSDLS